MLSTKSVIEQHFPKVANNKYLNKPTNVILKHLLCEEQMVQFSDRYPHLTGFDFVEQVLEYFHFGYHISDTSKERIPESGKLVIIANHPIGSLDALGLIKLIREIRSDIKVVANLMLMAIEPLHDILLPVNNMQGGTKKENLRNIDQHLRDEGVVIIFPAGEVSRLRPQGVRDTKWHSGFLRIARANQCPILPVFIDAKNSPLFYGVSMLFKPAATALLVKEMWKQQHREIGIKIGEIIPHESYQHLKVDIKNQVKLFKRHLYRVAKNKSPLLNTQAAIALPEERRALLKSLKNDAEVLGQTSDGKTIYLYNHGKSSIIMREIGRLREITFRAVGEGTNRRRDIDKFDSHYDHLILWDERELEIAGAYRFGKVKDIEQIDKLYSSTLFDYTPTMNNILPQGLELGRSFVQPKYWGKRSLDYLWQGIGAYLKKHPNVRYLFGPVTISSRLPERAISLIANCYGHYFPDNYSLATAKIPYAMDSTHGEAFNSMNYEDGYRWLKEQLSEMNAAVPTLYKQYADVASADGVSFSAFNVDPDFEYCVDALLVVDINKMKTKKKARYLGIE